MLFGPKDFEKKSSAADPDPVDRVIFHPIGLPGQPEQRALTRQQECTAISG
jgi:hypothetical protein